MLKRLANPTQREIVYFVVLAAVMIIFVPVLQTRDLPEARRFELEDKARSTLIQIIAASSVGLYFTLRNLRAMEKNVDLAERKLQGERFNEVTKMLTSDVVLSQAGGVHALGQLARSSGDYYWLCIESLLVFLQQHYSINSKELEKSNSWFHEVSLVSPPSAIKIAKEVLVLLRSREVLDELGLRQINRQIIFPPIAFSFTQIERVVFDETSLSLSYWYNSKIIDSSFKKASFYYASFQFAHIRDCYFEGADFRFVDFTGAVFVDVWVDSETNFGNAKLDFADLSGVQGLTQHHLELAWGNEETKLPKGVTRPNKWSREKPPQTQELRLYRL